MAIRVACAARRGSGRPAAWDNPPRGCTRKAVFNIRGNKYRLVVDKRLEFLSVLVEAYEDEHLPLDEHKGTPQGAVSFMLDQRGMTRADLHELMGGKARVSEFFSGKRPLSIGQVRALRKALGIPADLLIA